MNGIYLTEEGKQQIEAKIEHLKILEINSVLENFYQGQIAMLKEILSSVTILPVEESYNDIQHFETSEHGTVIRKHFLMANYSKGVIIQPKQ